MRKASSKKHRRQPADTVQAAARSMREMAERSEADAPPEITDEMRAAAAAFGRMGGLKGGPARAASMSKKKRSEIAKKAAAARWKK
jgi:hypothetical protein